MDELNKPLGTPAADKTSTSKTVSGSLLVLVCVAVLGAAYAGWSVLSSMEGQKTIATISDKPNDGQAEAPKNTGNQQIATVPLANQNRSNGANIDNELPDESKNEFGVKPLSPLEPRPSGSQNTQTAINQTQPSFKPVRPSQARRAAGLPNPDLVEQSEFGRLPKIATSGRRPLDEYSQSTGTMGANRVAIVIGGLGLSQTGTLNAIEKLPSTITRGLQ